MTPARWLALRILLAGAVLGLLLHFVPIGEVASALEDVHPVYAVLGVALQFLMRAAATPRMRVITANQGMDISHPGLFRILLTTQYYSMLLPGTLAAGGATWLKYVQAGGSKRGALAAVLLNRGISTLVMVPAGAMAWLVDRGSVDSGALIMVLVAIATLVPAAIVGCLLYVPFTPDPLRSPRWLRWPMELADRLVLLRLISPPGKLILVLSSLAFELVGALSVWCFARSVGISIEPLTAVWMRAVLELALLAPVHIAGLGVREASLVGLSALVGVAPAPAIAWSLAIFAGTLTVSVAGGLLEGEATARGIGRDKAPSSGTSPGDSG